MIPEEGQLVQARRRTWVVRDMVEHESGSDDVTHRVTLECLDDDRMGDEVDLIWDIEPHTNVYDALGFPQPRDWDTAQAFDAFINAVRWSAGSVVEGPALHAPFRGAIEIEEYQLEPVVRALQMPRVNLLIADDVGLGKTIEAGLVLQELIARQRTRRVMIICPASLQRQWQEEMLEKFRLDFRIIDRDEILRLRKEYGIHVNPWNSYPRLITSMDFIKRDGPKRTFLNSLSGEKEERGLREWDMLIVDEAHNIAPSGRTSYVRDSDRTRMARDLVSHFEHRLFLTATPHDGYTNSFSAMLELLDPLRFTRGPEVDREQVQNVMIRRTKDSVKDELGNRQFAERRVDALPKIHLADNEARLFDLLDRYTESRMERADREDEFPIKFALTLLKKRLLSSPLAFHRSLRTHIRHIEGTGDAQEGDIRLVKRLKGELEEEQDDDEIKAQREDQAVAESTHFFSRLTEDERQWLTEMLEITDDLKSETDSKAQVFLNWLNGQLKDDDGEWNDERAIVFTEYRDTLEYLSSLIEDDDRYMTLTGGMNLSDREEVKEAFQAPPSENPVRVLFGTDAASEGLNLQRYCCNLLHYEIPWNPNKMEQRNGRIDRHGQTAEAVFCNHFVYAGRQDSRFLQMIVDKVKTQREDLGVVGDVIEQQVEDAFLGERSTLGDSDQQDKIHQSRRDIESQLWTTQKVREIRQRVDASRNELQLTPANMRCVLEQGLNIAGGGRLEDVEHEELHGNAWWLRQLPPAWEQCRDSLRDRHGNLVRITFDHSVARNYPGIVLLHLQHPVMRRAISTFRRNIWATDIHEERGLRRASYRILAGEELAAPTVVAFGRVVATSEIGHRLHEDVVSVGAEINGKELVPLHEDLKEQLLRKDYEHHPIPAELGKSLRRHFPSHENALQNRLNEIEQREQQRLAEELQHTGEQNATDVEELIKERIEEVVTRLERVEQHEDSSQIMLPGFDPEEQEEGIQWFKERKKQLEKDLKHEPRMMQQRMKLRSLRLFPLGLLYLLPDTIIQQYD